MAPAPSPWTLDLFVVKLWHGHWFMMSWIPSSSFQPWASWRNARTENFPVKMVSASWDKARYAMLRDLQMFLFGGPRNPSASMYPASIEALELWVFTLSQWALSRRSCSDAELQKAATKGMSCRFGSKDHTGEMRSLCIPQHLRVGIVVCHQSTNTMFVCITWTVDLSNPNGSSYNIWIQLPLHGTLGPHSLPCAPQHYLKSRTASNRRKRSKNEPTTAEPKRFILHYACTILPWCFRYIPIVWFVLYSVPIDSNISS